MYEVIETSELGCFKLGEKGSAVSSIKFLRNKLNLLAGNLIGEVYMIRIECHAPLRVELEVLVDFRSRVWELAVSPFEPLRTWLVSC